MPRKVQAQQPGKDPAVKERLREICNKQWKGVLSRMADDLGLSQSALWQILHGKNPVNVALLSALADQDVVNVHWLLTGTGPRHVSASARDFPLATRLLPGSPKKHSELLDPSEASPLGGMSSNTAYWYRLSDTDAVVAAMQYGLSSGDFLLFETDHAQFPPFRELVGRLVVVAAKSSPRSLKIGLVVEMNFDAEGANYSYTVDSFDLNGPPRQTQRALVVRELSGSKQNASWRTLVASDPKADQKSAGEDISLNLLTVYHDDVMAVCMVSCRNPA